MPQDRLESHLRDLLPTLPETVVAVYLFGSAARGEAKPDSDVDLAFWRRERSRSTLADQPYALAAQLERALGREVDLVELNRAPPDLLHEVLRDGKLLLDRDKEFRIRAEVRGRADYLDLLPVLHRHRRRGAVT